MLDPFSLAIDSLVIINLIKRNFFYFCRYFEDVVEYFNEYASLIPISFVLGFYIDVVMERWWDQYNSIPFPDNLAIIVGASIKGNVSFAVIDSTIL